MNGPITRGHDYHAPAGYPADWAGPCITCGLGRWAPGHAGYPTDPATAVALAAQNRVARDLANHYREASTDLAMAREGFTAVMAALADPITVTYRTRRPA